MAQEPHVPTDNLRRIVRELYSCGITRERIAQRLKINVNTLVKYYEEELDNELENMTAALAKNLYRDAMDGCKADREFWLKTRGKFSFYKEPENNKNSNTEALLEKIIDKL